MLGSTATFSLGLLMDLTNSVLRCIGPSGREVTLHVGDRGSIPGRDRPKSFKQAMTAQLPKSVTVPWR